MKKFVLITFVCASLAGCADTSQLRDQAQAGDPTIEQKLENIEKNQAALGKMSTVFFAVVMGVLTAIATS